MRVVIVTLLLAAACGDNRTGTAKDDAGVIDGAGNDAGTDASVGELRPCLDRPTDLPQPPTGQLPCDLLPPDFAP